MSLTVHLLKAVESVTSIAPQWVKHLPPPPKHINTLTTERIFSTSNHVIPGSERMLPSKLKYLYLVNRQTQK